MAQLQMDITIARKVLETVDAGLVSGVGDPIPGQMCVEAAVCYAMGLPHGDEPSCVSPALRRFKIGLNDAAWPSPAARAKGLRRLALVQLGSAGALDDIEFAERLAMMTVNKVVPRAVRVLNKPALEPFAVHCEQASSLDAAAYAAASAAGAAVRAAGAAVRAAGAADAAAGAAVRAARAAYAADAADAAAYAADATDAAASAAAYAAYAAVRAAYARDSELATVAEDVVQILVDMGAPGAQWLYLAPLED